MPLYREDSGCARGQKRISATDLFFPDLTLRPPRRDGRHNRCRAANCSSSCCARSARASSAACWLGYAPARPQRSRRDARCRTRRIEATQELAAARSFWWVATGILTALSEGTLPAEVDVKQLCARIDLQIRRLLEGSKNVAERLMRDALYYVAQRRQQQRSGAAGQGHLPAGQRHSRRRHSGRAARSAAPPPARDHCCRRRSLEQILCRHRPGLAHLP